MKPRSAPMGKPVAPEVETVQRKVYRAKGARLCRFTLKAALRDAARLAFWKRYPCECDRGDSVTPPDNCGLHEHARIVSERLARLWLHRLRRGGAK